MGKVILFIFTGAMFFLACSNKQTNTNIKETTEAKASVVSFELIQFNEGWGYKVYVNSKLYITQNVIPGYSGNKAFVSATDAQKVATMVVHKIENGFLPPTIEMDELNKLGVKWNNNK